MGATEDRTDAYANVAEAKSSLVRNHGVIYKHLMLMPGAQPVSESQDYKI